MVDLDWDALDALEACHGAAAAAGSARMEQPDPPLEQQPRAPAPPSAPLPLSRIKKLQSKLPMLNAKHQKLGISAAMVNPDKVYWLHRSWLCKGADDCSGGKGYGCVACVHASKLRRGKPAKRFGSYAKTTLKGGNLMRHQKTAAHYANVLVFLGINISKRNVLLHTAPSVDDFKSVWDEAAKGVPPRSGIKHVGSREKVAHMQDCIAEGIMQLDRKFFKAAQVTLIIRDERHGRLLVRFRSANSHLQVRSGVLGQRKDSGSSACDIAKATDAITTKICTAGCGRPLQQRTILSEKRTPAVSYSALAHHLKATVEATCTDAASNEALATKLTASGSAEEGLGVIFPNHRLLIRDKAHASRRILLRPHNADEAVHNMVNFAIRNRHSIVQRIEHSEDMKRQFHNFIKTNETLPIDGAIKNLRAAKHRFESFAKPASRYCLWNDAVLDTAQWAVIARQGQTIAVDALAFLQWVNEENRLQLAMCADFADDCLGLTRWLDEEGVDLGELQQRAGEFCNCVMRMYLNGHCTQTLGFTKYTIERLSQVRLVHCRGVLRSIGGPGHPTEDTQALCLQRMACVAKLAISTVKAEFPAFEVINAFAMFSLAKTSDGDVDQAAHLKTLAQFLALDIDKLTWQFHLVRPYAQRVSAP